MLSDYIYAILPYTPGTLAALACNSSKTLHDILSKSYPFNLYIHGSVPPQVLPIIVVPRICQYFVPSSKQIPFSYH